MNKKGLYIIAFVFSISGICSSQVNKYGIPFIRNYTKEEYGASEQNWAVIQDNRGVMYFGNTDRGVLEYDGSSWRSIPIKNLMVRSLAFGNDKLYVGGLGEFGYLLPDKEGRLNYISLSEKLDSTKLVSYDVFKTHFFQNQIYFNAIRKLYKYRDDSLIWVKNLEDGFFFSFIVKDQFFIGNYYKGLYELRGDSIKLAKGGDFFIGKSIFSMLPFNGKILIGTSLQGLFLYDPNTGEVTTEGIDQSVNAILQNSYLYDGNLLPNNYFLLGMLQKGCLVLNNEGKLQYLLNEETGLLNKIITSSYSSFNDVTSDFPLWLTMAVGQARVDISIPFNKFGKESGINGGINDIINFNNELFIATDLGVSYLAYDKNGLPIFLPVKDLFYQSWSFHTFYLNNGERKLLVQTQGGVYEISESKIASSLENKIVNSKSSQVHTGKKVFQSAHDPSQLYIGYDDGCYVIQYLNGQWYERESMDYKQQVIDIWEEMDGDVWLVPEFDGILVKAEQAGNKSTISIFNEEQGLPKEEEIHFAIIGEKKVAITAKGFYYYDDKLNVFKKFDLFGDAYPDLPDKIYQHEIDASGNHWLSVLRGDKWQVELLIPDNKGGYILETKPFKVLPNGSVQKFYFDGDYVWIAISDELFSLKADSAWFAEIKNRIDFDTASMTTYNTLIRKVTIAEDSVLFYGTYYNTGDQGNILGVSLEQPDDLKYTMPYQYNSISFEFSAPYFIQEEKTLYSHKLEGFEKEWSKWSRETKAIYTNLNEGTYIFQVKAKNVYDVESTIASYEFTILPPWYRTILAYIIYVIIGICLVILIVRYYTKRLKRENERLEVIVAERTAEVVQQKDEIEKQRDKIAAQNKDIKDSIHYASRIQQAILPSEEVYKEDFFEHFVLFRPRDIVSGDFYWISHAQGKSYIVAADCTGHGVPGAFMSMLGISFLNEIISKSGISQPAQILNELRAHVVAALKQEGKIGEQKDGMDLALIAIDKKNKKLEFAGANNPLYWVRPLTEEEKKNQPAELPRDLVLGETHQLQQISADKMPIGISSSIDKSFNSYVLDIKEGHAFYIFSDGYVDQFGGEKGKKFMSKAFKELLLQIQHLPMVEQGKKLSDNIEEWMTIGQYGQVDDQLVIGVRIDKLS